MVDVEEHRGRRRDCGAFVGQSLTPLLHDVDGVGVEVDATSAGSGLDGAFDGAAHRRLACPADREA